MPEFRPSGETVTVTAGGVELDTPGTPLDQAWGCDLGVFLDEIRGQVYREAVRAALGEGGLDETLARVRALHAGRPPPRSEAREAPPEPSPSPSPTFGLAPELDALLPAARRLAVALAEVIGFPAPLSAADFQGHLRDEEIPVDAHFTGVTTHLRAHHAAGGLEIGLEASASWWNPRELANAHLAIFAIDRRKEPLASIRVAWGPPWKEALLVTNGVPAWGEAAHASIREHLPGMPLRPLP